MRSRSLARWLVVGALASFAIVMFAGLAGAQVAGGTAVQGQNGSTGSAANSGPVTGTNGAVLGAGPTSGAALGPSQSQQLGDNSVAVNQSANAKSGDAVAGSQVTGAVGGGDKTIQNSNSSIGSVALSGPANVSNVSVANAGPNALAIGGSANAAQSGSNHVTISQEAEAVSGDALAGSQTTGAVGGGITVQNSNNSFGSLAVSGPACASFVCGGGNLLFVGAGPSATSVGLLGVNAGAGQVGDNDVTISQSSVAHSGDALGGSQVTGAVGDDDALVQNQNRALGSFGFSGPAVATNVAAVNAGGTAVAIGLIGSSSQVSQAGDNRVVVDQDSAATSGDALAGSQVTGLVSSEIGNVTVQNQQSSDFDFAASGIAVAANVAPVNAGPTSLAIGSSANGSQVGGNTVIVSQGSNAHSGDALSGSGVVGVVGGGGNTTVQTSNHSALNASISGPAIAMNVAPVNAGPAAASLGILGLATANANQAGDNRVVVSQDAASTTGDALAGAQVTGIAGAGGDVTVQGSNDAFLNLGLSGPAVSANFAPVTAGPLAGSLGILTLFGANANASQFGDNNVGVDQSAEASTGDALSGSQVTGIVAEGGRTTVQNQNHSVLGLSASGPSVAVNLDGQVVGPRAGAVSVLSLGGANSGAQQFGSNNVGLAQTARATTGDAVTGSQVTGVVNTGGDLVIANQNDSLFSASFTGPAIANNSFLSFVGPNALTASFILGLPTASASQAGNNNIGYAQDVSSASGDAVAGSQIVGGAGNVGGAVMHQNHALAALGTSGIVTGANAADGNLGPAAATFGLGGPATTQQSGSSSLLGDQVLDLASGDGIASGQVVGLA